MVCREVRDQLLVPEGPLSPELNAHLAECAACARAAVALARFDGALQSVLVIQPPDELESRLATIAAQAATAEMAVRVRLGAAFRAALVAPPPAELQARLAAIVEAGAAAHAAQTAARELARERLDVALRASLLAQPPLELQTRLAAVADEVGAARASQTPARELAREQLDVAFRAALIAPPPVELQARVAAIAAESVASGAVQGQPAEVAQNRLDIAVRAALVAEPPAEVQARLAALTPASRGSWLADVWRSVRARPGVLAGQAAALAVLAYAVMQLVAWVGTFPIVWGDVPYAIELLVLSPAVDYLSQVEAVVQQLGLWLLVAAAGWILAQGWPWQRQPEP